VFVQSVLLPASVSSALTFDEPGNAVWFATVDGRVRTWRLLGGRHDVHGAGWADVIAVLPADDALTVFVVTADGRLYRVGRASADRARAELWVAHDTALVSAHVLEGDRILLLDADGAVLVMSDRAIRSLSPATGATALCVLEGAFALATPQNAAATTLDRRSLVDGSPLDTITVPHPVTAMTPLGSGVVIVDDGGIVTHVSWSSGESVATYPLGGATVHGQCSWHSLLFAASGDVLTTLEWGTDVETLPITATLQPLASGAWTPVTVDYGAIGLTAEDVEWYWDDNPADECLSVAGAEPGSGAWEHRVLGGPIAGERVLVAVHRASGDVLATRRFRILAAWPDTEVGPPQVISGQRQVYAKGGWGGGPGAPQNIRKHPAPEEFRIAVAMFRCKGSKSAISMNSTAADTRRDELTQHIVRTTGDSVDRWFREVSFADTPGTGSGPKGTRVRLLRDTVIGPIDVPYSFAELFAPGNAADEFGSWDPLPDTWDRLGGTFSSFVRDNPVVLPGGASRHVMDMADAVVFTILPGSDQPEEVAGTKIGAQWTWAYASDAQVYWKPSDGSTTFTRKPAVCMPAAISSGHATPWAEKEYVTTIVHELGHTLGMPDLYEGPGYPAEIGGRYMGTWEMMAADVPMPQLSLPHRMRLGWIDPSWVEVCDFSKNPATREVTLQALESLARTGPGSGRKAGVEIRLRDGWNYYFEHRRDQAGQIGDQRLPADAVLGTDVFQAQADDMARPLILLLPDDADGDGSVLVSATRDYEESDVTNPDRMNDFRLTRLAAPLGADANDVRVRVEYVGAHRAELQITPARGNGEWKSPDIDIDGPSGPNVVVKGQKHRIRIRVRNAGTKAAASVTLRVGWLPFTTTPGSWSAITPPAPKAIAAKSSAIFDVEWEVPASVTIPDAAGTPIAAEHFCVRVDVDRYVDPLDPNGDEIVVHNNWAQSNFNTAMTRQSSPSSRDTTAVTSSNPFPTRALQRHVVEQTGEQFRLFLDEGWRQVDAGATSATRLAFESFAGDPRLGREYAEYFEQSGGEGVASDVSVRTFVLPEGRHDAGIPGFGAGLWLRAGWRTRFEAVESNGEVIFGRVIYEHDGTVDPVSFGEVRVVAHAEDRPDQPVWLDGGVDQDGLFYVPLGAEVYQAARAGRWVFEAFFFSNYRYTPTRSGMQRLEV